MKRRQKSAKHKKAVESLRKSEERYKELADSLPQTVFETDERGNLTFANRTAFEIFGYTQDDFDKGINVLQTLIPDDRDRAKKNIRRVMSGEELGGTEYTALKKDGSTFPALIHSSPIIHENKPVGLRGCLIDITKRKQTEEEVKSYQKKIEALINSSKDLVFLKDKDFRYLIANKAHEKVFNIKVKDIIGKTDFDFMPKEVAEGCRRSDEKTLKSKDPIEKEEFAGDRCYHIVKQRVVDVEGNIMGIAAVIREITARKKMEEALQKHTRDLGERVKELNCLYEIAQLVEKPEISLEEIIQGTVELIPPAWQYPEITCARVTLEAQEYRTANFRETAWKQASDIVVYDNRIGALEVYYLEEKPEIGEGPFLKEERSLINTIAERLGKITERKKAEEDLRRAIEELKALDKMKSDFVSNVSHELRSPMTSIKGYTDLILMGIAGKINQKQREFLITVKKNADRLTRLIDDLLDISRLDAGRIELNLQTLNIPGLVQEIVKSYQIEARARKISLETDLPEEFPLLRADSDRIKQVLTNLVGNALKFTPPQGKIVLGFQGKKKEALFWVKDTGPGIAQKDLSTIFEKFQQLGKRKKTGTGLGLAIAKGLVELHKGRIWAESQRGKGSAFYFALPKEKNGKSE